MPSVNRDELSPRRLQIRLDPEHRPIVIDELILRIKIVQQLHNFTLRLAQIFVVHASLRRSAWRDCDDEIPSIVSHGPSKQHLLIVRTLVDQLVLRLRSPQRVVIQLLKVIRIPQCRPLRLIVTAIAESLLIFRPCRSRELRPLHKLLFRWCPRLQNFGDGFDV